MAEKRLIDANALLETHRRRLVQNSVKVENGTMTKPYSNFEAAIMECLAEYLSSAPSIDAVEVVRCRECVHNEDEDVCPFVQVNCGKNWLEIIKPHPDGFCHKGAKMDGSKS